MKYASLLTIVNFTGQAGHGGAPHGGICASLQQAKTPQNLGSNLDGLLPKYDFQSSSDFMKMRHQ
ncbi:MAG TPA: hypothetical protein ENI07_09580 [Desulfobacterales bacterium]|nr:hypothetical protein [Desulfobacterales bacterium]